LIGFIWTQYTDAVKSLNEFGVQLTSTALLKWNWGTTEQRVSLPLIKEIIWDRIFVRNAGGFLGAGLFLIALVFVRQMKLRYLILLSLVFTLLPIYLFINLHHVHDYYQVACVIFLIGGLALIIAEWLPLVFKTDLIIPIAALCFVILNVYQFDKQYLPIVMETYTAEKNKELAIANVLNSEVPPEYGFVAFGNDWNSALAYFSQRKSFTVPDWFKDYEKAQSDPQSYLGDTPLGGIVVCPSEKGSLFDKIFDRYNNDTHWKVKKVFSCRIILPNHLNNI